MHQLTQKRLKNILIKAEDSYHPEQVFTKEETCKSFIKIPSRNKLMEEEAPAVAIYI